MIHFVEQQRFFLRFCYGALRSFGVYMCCQKIPCLPKFWTPEKGQLLNCFHESGNVFDPLAIDVCERNSEKRVANFLERYQGSPNP